MKKKNIEISQIRTLIDILNKSSFNLKPRFVLIDNIEFLNTNSINALLKIIEEPNDNIFFILINNNKKILSTLTSRCLNFRLYLSNDRTFKILKNIFNTDINNLINKDLLNYYFTPGKIYNLIKFSNDYNINLKDIDLKKFLFLLIDQSLYKKNLFIKNILYEFIEIFLIKNVSNYSNIFDYFIHKIDNVKQFSLDDESLFIEFKYKLLNG